MRTNFRSLLSSLILFLSSNCLIFGQVLNGDFESWELYNNSEIPSVWYTGIESTDYSSVLLKDSDSYSGDYCLKMVGGTVYSEGDCLRVIVGTFNLPEIFVYRRNLEL